MIAAHPDDAERQMGGTLAKLAVMGQHILLVELTDGEPTEFGSPGQRAEEAQTTARTLGVDRLALCGQDRLLEDATDSRLEVAYLLRRYRPLWVYATSDACVHPDHAAAASITRAAVFLARLRDWDRVLGGERLAKQEPRAIDRLFFPPLQDGAAVGRVCLCGRRQRGLQSQALGGGSLPFHLPRDG